MLWTCLFEKQQISSPPAVSHTAIPPGSMRFHHGVTHGSQSSMGCGNAGLRPVDGTGNGGLPLGAGVAGIQMPGGRSAICSMSDLMHSSVVGGSAANWVARTHIPNQTNLPMLTSARMCTAAMRQPLPTNVASCVQYRNSDRSTDSFKGLGALAEYAGHANKAELGVVVKSEFSHSAKFGFGDQSAAQTTHTQL